MTVNRYPGKCADCGSTVAAGAGTLRGKRGRRWTVAHLVCEKKGEPAVIQFVIGGEEFIQNSEGRCIDAPCCGCCS